MSRIAARFEYLRSQGRKALIPYVTAGDPEPANTVPLMHELVNAGADIVELGVPFSDPMADGPVIQQACERALKHHVSLRDVLGMVREFRRDNTTTPVVLMGYLNPVEIMGYETFAREAAEAGVDGLLTVDLPPEEGADLVQTLTTNGIDPIFLLAPTSHEGRIKAICAAASGFVYYVSLKGVTGAATLDVDAVAEKLALIRQHTDLPVGVGFGISDAPTAARVGRVADAVVVGSALVKLLAANTQDLPAGRAAAADLLGEMRQAMDAAPKA
ncbi:Tryptophan synthase alpha chain [Ectothiorhodospira haloalkaliphila]|uniref:Tryptophan synthase alpha chain n=1 Tax=Ectothiorhodospira haloalkaliphila TaxID=421628 RepID=W8KT93_9GAMM|nr:tryptophan synthase subunit alpha [Ectothiorhodospira haloalkaliphila]MCG5495310.1 tryptophan synthase subunit alpha [Ectothiorhodospira variabilis]AHK78791.1 Tryptophan synthase alpha chain [Ectothiorhodospira haloalkaliphila]MCG5497449.1 tryptophan synthase subunit alpha [Ectothiorhodospira variabilis]MCG5504908.1 tryptophan synthase subunit alpha [Ectothiorhodospira variabilis]MCG5508065.1 tryptophan synthase subunit alpha [Ectothiorhodospira variabilis]